MNLLMKSNKKEEKMSTSIAATKSDELHEDKASRYQQLVQKKAALEKQLNEKYEQLHQLCQKEANLIGNNFDLTTQANSSANSSSSHQSQTLPIHHHHQQQQQQRKIHQNEINKLLIEKQKQQQLSQTSLSIINDPMQSKSLRRTHKQAYELSQQKIEQLNENLSHLQIHQQQIHVKAQDDIDLHRSDNRFMKNALAMVGNTRNLHMLNVSNTMSMSERRNSMKSTTSSLGSSNTFIIQSSPSSATSLTSLKTLPNNIGMAMHSPRTRQDGTFSRYEFEVHKGNDSPTPSTMSMQHPSPQINHQIPLCSQSLKNIKINTDHHSYHHPQQQQYSPQIHQQQSPQYYVQNNNSNNNNFVYQQQAQPQTQSSQHFAPPPRQIPPQNEHKFLQRLHSFNHQLQHDRNHLIGSSLNSEDARTKTVPKYQVSPNHYTVSHSAGLGGYWTINEHNQRVWIADTKYPLSPPNQNSNMAKKSNSLGNFDFMHKNDENQQPDAVSISSGNSNDIKKKEKIWCETSLDSPPEQRKLKPRIESPTPSCYSAADYINNNSNQVYENTPPSSRQMPIVNSNNNTLRIQPPENGFYNNPLANVPNLPPKSKLRYSESTRSTMSNRDFENNIVNSIHSPLSQHLQSPIHVESPVNVTIIQEGSWKPYKEEIKSYEISDFYKYSEKYRQQQQKNTSNVN